MNTRFTVRTPLWYLLGLCLSAIAALALVTGSPGVSKASAAPQPPQQQKQQAPQFTASPTTTSTPTLTPACGLTWRTVTSPNPYYADQLTGVDVVSESNIWAVGYMGNNGGGITMIVHWDGSQWSLVPSPNIPDLPNFLNGISVVAANDIWAVGYSGSWYQGFNTLILHWDGAAWSIVDSPNVGSSMLKGISAVSANDIWAVGHDGSTTNGQNLILHWDGAAWSVVPAPNASTLEDDLRGVSAISANDAWAVGEYWNEVQQTRLTLTLHWDGNAWSVVSNPSPPAISMFYGVKSISANDVWAVGYSYDATTYTNRALTMHWNGNTWTIVQTPFTQTLYAVASTASDDVWAVGDYSDAMGGIIIHWNGTQWTRFANTNGNSYAGVVPVWRGDVWAVGTQWPQTAIAHYSNPCATATSTPTVTATVTGTPPTATSTRTVTNTPTITRTPTITNTPISTITNTPRATPTNTSTEGPSNTPSTFIPTYTPTRTATYPQPTTTCCNPGGNVTSSCSAPDTYNYDLTLFSDTPNCAIPLSGPVDLYFEVSNDPGGAWTDLDHYYAGNVTLMPGQTIHITGSFSEPSIPAGDIWYRIRWTMGYVNCLGGRVAEGYNDAAPLCASGGGTATPTPTAGTPAPSASVSRTATTGLPTEPPSSVTATATGTQTACTVIFADVPSDNTFYPYVMCLACRGIVSGYQCGETGEPCNGGNDPYFRLGANVSRGQIAKIVSSSAGYVEDPNPQIYEDVDPANPFYQWIDRLSYRGFMSGYPCGTIPGEPCNPPADRPYFRPFASATRAQLTKIVSNTAGISDPPVGQTFADVPSTNQFYTWVQRLASRAIMGGYPCGAEGEPCDDQNRPYFRPYNNVTKGQTSKIVSNAFFPSCDSR